MKISKVLILSPTWIGVNWRALKEDGGAAVGQRPVDDVAVTRDPADVGHAAKHVAVVVAKHILKGWWRRRRGGRGGEGGDNGIIIN